MNQNYWYEKGKPVDADKIGNFEKGVGFNFFHEIFLSCRLFQSSDIEIEN